MTFTVIMIVCVGIVLGIAAMFGAAVSKGYDYKHKVDPLPDDADQYKYELDEDKKSDAN